MALFPRAEKTVGFYNCLSSKKQCGIYNQGQNPNGRHKKRADMTWMPSSEEGVFNVHKEVEAFLRNL